MEIKIDKVHYGQEGYLVKVERQREWAQEDVVYGFWDLVEILVEKVVQEYGPEHLNKINIEFDGIAEGATSIFNDPIMDGKIPNGEKVIIRADCGFLTIGDKCDVIIEGTVDMLDVGRYSRVICKSMVKHLTVQTGSIVSGTLFNTVGKSEASIVSSYAPPNESYDL